MPSVKPRILFLITTSDWGGAQHFLVGLARAAKEAGHTVLVASGETGELSDRCLVAGVPYHQLTNVVREISPLKDLAALHEIRLLIRDFQPGIVHLNSSKMGVIGALAADLERVPRTIYRIGGWAFLEVDSRSWLSRQIYLAAERWSASKKDIIVTVHPGDTEEAKRNGIRPRHRIFTIANGLDLDIFDRTLLSRTAARRELGIPDDAFVVGTVANFYPPKRIPWTLTALTPWLAEKNTRHLVVIGDGPERMQVEAAYNVSQTKTRIHLLGRRTDASALLPAFDVFLLPSSKEGMPWALLEAMAAKLPCMATDVGACRWMLEPDAGIIIPPHDSEVWHRELTHLEEDDALRVQLGQAARETVESRFRWKTAVTQSLALFDV